MKKRFLIYGTLAALCLGVGIPCFWPGRGVNLVNYFRINLGMTANEVEELLDSRGQGPLWRQGTPIRVPNQGWIEGWRGYAGTIFIVYDKQSRVVETDWNWEGSYLNDLNRVVEFQVRE
jgi:hypothetical protein